MHQPTTADKTKSDSFQKRDSENENFEQQVQTKPAFLDNTTQFSILHKEKEIQKKSAPVQTKEEDEELGEETIQESEMQNNEEALQMKEAEDGNAKVKGNGGSKTSLSDSLQSKMENSFGADFSDVNIHKNDEEASELGALAYTQGNDVHFAPGQFDEESEKGQELIGHELTHVVQQRSGKVSPTSSSKASAKESKQGFSEASAKKDNINDDQSLEKEADDAGAKAAQGKTVGITGSGSGIQLATQKEREEFFDTVKAQKANGKPLTDEDRKKYKRYRLEWAKEQRTSHLGEARKANKAEYTSYITAFKTALTESESKIKKAGPKKVKHFQKKVLFLSQFQKMPELDIYIIYLCIAGAYGKSLGFVRNIGKTDYYQNYSPSLELVKYMNKIDNLILQVNLLMVDYHTELNSSDTAVLDDSSKKKVGDAGKGMGLKTGSGGDGTVKGSGIGSDAPVLQDTKKRAKTPDSLVPFVGKDGKQYVNVWAGRKEKGDKGANVPIEIREGESEEAFRKRIEEATLKARQKLADEETKKEDELTKGNFLQNEHTFNGGKGGGLTANAPAYRATMNGPEVMVKNGTGAYNVSLHYEDYNNTLLGQVASAFSGADFIWQIINITELQQKIYKDKAEGIKGDTKILDAVKQSSVDSNRSIGNFDADKRRFERVGKDLAEDAATATYDLADPIGSQDGSSGKAIRSVLMNTFNLQTLPLHSIMSYGGWLVTCIPSVFSSNYLSEKEIPFPDENGYYLIRCVAQPRPSGGDNPVIHLPSLATKVVEVKDINKRTEQELQAVDLNLQASIMEMLTVYRFATDSATLKKIEKQLKLAITQAAQTNQSFIKELIDKRNKELENKKVGEDVKQRIRKELEILGAGKGTNKGLVVDILTGQLALKQEQYNALKAKREKSGSEYITREERQLFREISILKRKIGTAKARNDEMVDKSNFPIIKPQAVFVNEENGQTIPLLLEIGKTGGSLTSGITRVMISDITSANGDIFTAQGESPALAVQNAIKEYAGHFPYGRGFLRVKLPDGNAYGVKEQIQVRCKPHDTAQASERLDELLQVLAIIGMFVPGVGVAVAAVGAAVSAARILNRLSNHTFSWDMDMITDVMNIVGAVASGVGRIAGGRLIRAQRMFAIVPDSVEYASAVKWLSTISKITQGAEKVTEWGSFMIGQMQIVNQFMEIQRAVFLGQKTHAEARREKAKLLLSAASDTIMQFSPAAIEKIKERRGDGVGTIKPTKDSDGDGKKPKDHVDTTDSSTPKTTKDIGDSAKDTSEKPVTKPENPQVDATPNKANGAESGSKPKDVEQPNDAKANLERVLDAELLHTLIADTSGKTKKETKVPSEAEKHAAALKVLKTYGNWRDLIMHLSTDSANPLKDDIIKALGDYRQTVVDTIGKKFGLAPIGTASAKATSDVDLSSKSDSAEGGKNLKDAEVYMSKTYGDNWEKLFRMNFYTDAGRLYLFEKVKSNMSTDEFKAYQKSRMELSEILSFAKMLHHAGKDKAGRERVEKLMDYLSAEQKAKVYKYEADAAHDKKENTHKIHEQIDALYSAYKLITDPQSSDIPKGVKEKIPADLPKHLKDAILSADTAKKLQTELAKAISEQQMHANFRTEEAYVTPGAGRQIVTGTAVKGIEAYESMLGQLEMMEHDIAAKGGNIEATLREYEIYKYINRFITAMHLAGVRPDAFMLAYYQIASDMYMVDKDRTMLQDVNRHDTSYLKAMHDHFLKEVRASLPQIRDAVKNNPGVWEGKAGSLDAPGVGTGKKDTDSLKKPDAASRLGHIRDRGESKAKTIPTVGEIFADRAGMSLIKHVPVKVNSSIENPTVKLDNFTIVVEIPKQGAEKIILNFPQTMNLIVSYERLRFHIWKLETQVKKTLGEPEVNREIALMDMAKIIESHKASITSNMLTFIHNATLQEIWKKYQDLYSFLLNEQKAIGKIKHEAGDLKPLPDDWQKQEEEESAKQKDDEKPVQQKKSATPAYIPMGVSFGNKTTMPEPVQTKMEQSFGTDFSNVNVHTNDESATQMGALAYTKGWDIHFAPGQYNPESQKGQELLGHELTHVVQQKQGKVQPTSSSKASAKEGKQEPFFAEASKGTINDDPSLEHEADVMGAKAAAGKDATAVRGNGSGVQMQEVEGEVENDVSDYKITESGGKIKVKLGEGEDDDTNTKEIAKTVDELRLWIIKNYNWNAIVAIMEYCSDKDVEFTYIRPLNLGGTDEDDSKIIPVNGLVSIVRLQTKHKIDELGDGFAVSDYANILSSVDGLPGTSFAKDIMEQDSKNDLMNELDNTTLTNDEGKDINIPDMNASEETLYTFFKEITLARNGLWSDKENITNVVSIRRKLDDNVTKYNDTIAVCWMSTEGDTETKHAKLYTSTTEPGEINNHRKLVPQTITMQLGYHKGKQPSGRTSQALIRNSGNSETLNFNSEDTTMNFHHGGNGQVDISGMSTNGLSSDYISTDNNEFGINLLFISAFRILTQWGQKQNVKAYDYLKEWKDAKKYSFEKFEDGNAEIKKEGEENVEKKDVEGMKSYIASKYSNSTESKETFIRIIQSVDDSFKSPDNLDELDKDGLKALITNEHLQGILEKQMDYSNNGDEIDGKPGSSFIKILDNEVTSFDDMKTKATADYTSIEQVFTDLKVKLGDDVGKEKVDYLKALKPGTLNERTKYENASENDDESKVINQNVGAWSEGCQVIFGPEKFYEFWDNVTNKAKDSGQRRWYYTIIDAETLETETEEEAE